MKIISYSFDVPQFRLGNVDAIASLIKTIDNYSEENSQLSEVIITTESHINNHLLEDLIKNEIIRSTSIKIVASDKRSKAFTRPTLVADIFVGDMLVMTRSDCQMSMLFYNLNWRKRSYTGLFDTHLSFLEAETVYTNSSSKLYKRLNSKYRQQLIDEKTVGFIASRQTINSVMSAEKDIYDLFISLAVSNISRRSVKIENTVSVENVYTKDESLEVLSKFAKTSYDDHVDAKIGIFFFCLIAIFSIVSITYYKSLDFSSLAALIVSSFVYLIADAASSHLSMLSKQSFAAANKKYIAGNAIVIQLNKK